MEAKRKTTVIVYAGPNGFGKSTITSMLDPVGEYINADDIKKVNNCSDLEAAEFAQTRREQCIANHKDFTFETVLSTTRNLELLKQSKANDYFIRCFYVLTASSDINVARVQNRVNNGGHSVSNISVFDICNIYDNTENLFRIFSKGYNNL